MGSMSQGRRRHLRVQCPFQLVIMIRVRVYGAKVREVEAVLSSLQLSVSRASQTLTRGAVR